MISSTVRPRGTPYLHDMRAGHAVILIEAKGDLFHLALGGAPLERMKDIIILDVGDGQYPVDFNVLQGNPEVVASDLHRLFEHLYPRMPGAYASARACTTPS